MAEWDIRTLFALCPPRTTWDLPRHRGCLTGIDGLCMVHGKTNKRDRVHKLMQVIAATASSVEDRTRIKDAFSTIEPLLNVTCNMTCE